MATRKPATKTLHKVIRDPVHNLISLDGDEGELILDLIDQPEFQRLRRIRQLGLALLTYPGAEHSRWAHSLGVCHVASRMLNALLARYTKGSKEHKQLAGLRREIVAAALLHDVGHGPFSHVFERAIPNPKNAPRDYPKDHEGWSERIIRERFEKTLKKHRVRVDIVTGLINKADRNNLLAKDIISSQLDADRMDYLLRDSWATGPQYGQFDLEWLLHSIRIGSVKVRGQAGPLLRLCFDSSKAVHAVEEYIQAREFMYVQVYTHKTTRAYESMLANALGLASVIAAGNPGKVPQPCPRSLAQLLAGKPITTNNYLSLDDFGLWRVLIEWSQQRRGREVRFTRLRRLCERIVNRSRPYRVIEIDVGHDEGKQQKEKAIGLRESLKNEVCSQSFYLDLFEDLAYRNLFYRKSGDDEEQEHRAIHFVEESGLTLTADKKSEVIRAISNIETKVCRFYYDETDPKILKHLATVGLIKKPKRNRINRKGRAS